LSADLVLMIHFEVHPERSENLGRPKRRSWSTLLRDQITR
jgi:hypothetical protein